MVTYCSRKHGGAEHNQGINTSTVCFSNQILEIELAASTDVNFQIVCVPTNLTKKLNQDMQMMPPELV